MTAVVKEIFDAFKKAGVPDKEAWDAAAALSTHEVRFADLKADIDALRHDTNAFRRDVDRRFEEVDRRFGAVETRLHRLQGEIGGIKGEIGDVRTELRMHPWALAVVVALDVGILVKLLTSEVRYG